MAFTRIFTIGINARGAGTTGSGNSTSANLFVAAVWDDPSSPATLSDSMGNTYTSFLTQANGGGTRQMRLFHCINPATSATHTWTLTGGGTNQAFGVSLFSATPGIVVVDSDSTTGSGTSITTPSVTVGTNDLIFSAWDVPANVVPTSMAASNGSTITSRGPAGTTGFTVSDGTSSSATATTVTATYAATNSARTAATAVFRDGQTQTVSPSVIASAQSIGSHTVVATLHLQPTVIASAEDFGDHLVSTLQIVTPTVIASAESIGNHTVTATLHLQPTIIASAEAFGTHDVYTDPWVLLSHTIAGTGTSGSTSAIDTTGADLIVAFVSKRGSANPTLSDSEGNTWTLQEYENATGADSIGYYCINPTTSATHTFSLVSDNLGTLAVMAFSCGALVAFDGSTGNTAVTTVQPGSITPTANGALLVTCMADAQTAASSSNATCSGFIDVDEIEAVASTYDGLATAYLTQRTAAAVNPTWSASGTVQRTSVMMAFVPSSVATISPSVIASAEDFGNHVVSTLQIITPTVIASAEDFGDHTVSIPGGIQPTIIASAESFGDHIVSTPLNIGPSVIASAESFGSHTVTIAFDVYPLTVVDGELYQLQTYHRLVDRFDAPYATEAYVQAVTGADGAGNFEFDTVVGTQIGTGVTQKLAFWGATPIVQPSGANQAALTNSTGGSYDGTLAAISGSGDDANINNNFTDVHTLLGEIRTALVDAGLMKGSS